MLLQITNKCAEQCPHCLQNSLPDSLDMTDDVLEQSIDFIKSSHPRVTMISGGEPFMRKDILRICQRFDKEGLFFVIATNGVAIASDDSARYKYLRIKELKHCLGIQVYTHKDFYKDYELVKSKELLFGKELTTERILNMQDLGRAKTSELAQQYIDNHHYHCSCLNTYLISRQIGTFRELLYMLEQHGHYCHPLIDYKGNLHASESNLCQSFGTIYDDQKTLLRNLMRQKPCTSCKLGRRFYESERPDIVQARNILNVKITDYE